MVRHGPVEGPHRESDETIEGLIDALVASHGTEGTSLREGYAE